MFKLKNCFFQCCSRFGIVFIVKTFQKIIETVEFLFIHFIFLNIFKIYYKFQSQVAPEREDRLQITDSIQQAVQGIKNRGVG